MSALQLEIDQRWTHCRRKTHSPAKLLQNHACRKIWQSWIGESIQGSMQERKRIYFDLAIFVFHFSQKKRGGIAQPDYTQLLLSTFVLIIV
jgi:hypothetical protein